MGVWSSSASATNPAIFPISVLSPVATTIPIPLPEDMAVPAKSIFFWSFICFTSEIATTIFPTGADSPVRDASLTRRLKD